MNELQWYDAQVAVLGSALRDEERVATVLAGSQETDYAGAYRPIYAAIRQLHEAGRPADPVTVTHALGEAYRGTILEIMQLTPTAEHCEAYLGCLREVAQLRRYQDLGDALRNAADPDEARRVAEEIAAVGAAHVVPVGKGQRELLQAYFESIGDEHHFLPMALDWLDKHLHLDRGDFLLIGGLPSDGKTALALQIGLHQASGYKVGFFSLETSAAKIEARILAHASGVDYANIQTRRLSDEESGQLAAAANWLSSRRIDVIEAAGWTVAQICDYSQRMGYEIIYIDYVQIISPPPGLRSDNLVAAMTQISKGLHTFAQRSKTLVIGLSQLSRDRERRRPQLNRLRESGQLEQDANAVLFLWREKEDDKTSRMLTIAKNKEGETGDAYLLFDGAHQRFSLDRNAIYRKRLEEERKQRRKSAGGPADPPELRELPEYEQEALPF